MKHRRRPVSSRLAPLLAGLLSLALALCLGGCAVSQEKLPPEQILAASSAASRDTTIALLGATGMVGGHILREALARGYPVKALARSPEKLAVLAGRVEIISGDARDPAAIARLLAGSDVVVSSIGPVPGDPGGAGLTATVTANIIAALADRRVVRYLLVSGAGVVAPGDARDARGWLIRQLARLRYPALLADRQNEMALLLAADIDFTVLRCPLIASGPPRAGAASSQHSPGGFTLGAGDLARFILDEIESGALRRQAPFLHSPLR